MRFGLFPASCVYCVLAWYLNAFAYENCVNVWRSFSVLVIATRRQEAPTLRP